MVTRHTASVHSRGLEGGLPAAVVEPILRYVGEPDARWTVTHWQVNRLSTTVFVGIESALGMRHYVVKLGHSDDRQSDWSPEAEFRSLQRLWTFGQSSTALKLQEPVAYGLDPPHLTTVFIPGVQADRIVKAGCRRFSRPAQRQRAIEACRRMGNWVAEKRRLTMQRCDARPFEEYEEFCRARLNEIGRFYGAAGRRLAEQGQAWLDALPVDHPLRQCFPITQEYAQHHDCTPQNFLITADGTPCGIDFERLRYSGLMIDESYFRLWLGGVSVNPLCAKGTVQACWAAFAARAVDNVWLFQTSNIRTLLAHLAWRRDPNRKRLAAESLTIRAKNRIWITNRMGYLARLFTVPHDRMTEVASLDQL